MINTFTFVYCTSFFGARIPLGSCSSHSPNAPPPTPPPPQHTHTHAYCRREFCHFDCYEVVDDNYV